MSLVLEDLHQVQGIERDRPVWAAVEAQVSLSVAFDAVRIDPCGAPRSLGNATVGNVDRVHPAFSHVATRIAPSIIAA